MKIGDVYINTYSGQHVVIIKISYKHEQIYYKYINGRNANDRLSFRTFFACYKFSEKFTNEHIIRGIIE